MDKKTKIILAVSITGAVVAVSAAATAPSSSARRFTRRSTSPLTEFIIFRRSMMSTENISKKVE
ncbi:MAG: hypothetical protein Q4A05_03450 [Ruminococcus sp.]|nr:hypothetical protein [Ruminococcus sp.]